MTGADGAAGPDAGPGWRWDVALSFAGAQRPYVEQVAGALKARGLRCFYDADEQIDLWGKYLAEELPAIYGEQAAAVVVFVSAEYAARDWTRLERRAALNRAVRERGEYVLPARFDDTPLPGLLSDLVAVDLRGRTPQQFAAMIADKLARLAITASASSAGAGDLARDVEPAPPAGAVRAGDADPRRLGVHAAISVQGVPDDVLPVYVPRDTDTAENGVRVKVAAAAERGGFVLLVGGSSVGKTRCAVEAVKAVLPEWWLVHPVGPAEIAALARVPVPHTVVWLDELQRYLDGEHGLTGGVVRALLDGPHPVVIIGTLWPDRYAGYTTVPTSGGADPHAREREVLDLAAVVRIGPEFSEAEQGRARAAARRDPRLRVALEAAGYGLTQTLAAAPQLVARWEDAQTASPYGWAVLAAALDAARLGAHAPLSADFLRAAAPGYCTSQQQAEAPGNWFEQALAYAAGKLHGAVAALSPAGAGMGRIAGYTVADYLIQHASRERRYERMPASTWDAILRHLRHLPDAAAAGQTYLDVGWAAYGRQQAGGRRCFPEGNGQRRCSGGNWSRRPARPYRADSTGRRSPADGALLGPGRYRRGRTARNTRRARLVDRGGGQRAGGIRNSQRCLARHPQNLRRRARIQPSRWTGSGPLDWALGEHGRGPADRPPGPGGLHPSPWPRPRSDLDQPIRGRRMELGGRAPRSSHAAVARPRR